jgi:hypothetical protein
MWISHFLDTCNATASLLRSSLFRTVTQRWSVVRYRRFGTSWSDWSLKIGPVGCPEMSVTTYHSKLRNIPEERRPHLHRDGRSKSRMPGFCLKNSGAEFHNKINTNTNTNNNTDQIWGSHSGYCAGVFSEVKQTSVVHMHKHFEAQCCFQLCTQQWGVLWTQRLRVPPKPWHTPTKCTRALRKNHDLGQVQGGGQVTTPNNRHRS